MSTTNEREALIATPDRHRGFLLLPAAGLTEEQSRTASTVSQLTIAGLLKHVADTEEQWMEFAVRGAEAFGGSDVYDGVDWSAVDDAAEENQGDWSGSEWEDTRFVVPDDLTLDQLRRRVIEVGEKTAVLLRTADLDTTHPLPEAPWFEPGAAWSLRRVALHMLAEIAQHAGHADILREAIDGKKSMG